MKKTTQVLFTTLILFLFASNFTNAQSILFDNGPYFNSTGTGAGGANESVLYTTSFGMSTIGFGHQQALFNRVADDFTINDCKWKIDSIVFFGYQTGSTTTSTFTGVTFRIWDSIPSEAAPLNVVYGDTTTNAMIRSVWSGAYRITETTVGNSTRPIMRNTCIVNSLMLNTGTYWIDWASSGSLASGPWAPARTPVATAITGNGRQRIVTVWNNAVDGGTGTPAQGFPFIIYGTVYNATADAGLDITSCEGQTTMLGGSPPGTGTGSLSYAWTPSFGLIDTTQAIQILSVSDSTSYILTVTDSIGCVDMDTIFVNAYPLPTAMITPAGPTSFCTGNNVTLNAFTDVGYEYLWGTTDTTTSIIVNSDHNYTLDVTNSFGCTNSDTILITVYPLPIANITPPGATNFFCTGDSITLTADAGLSYNYSWSTSETTQSVNISSAGVIVLDVTDSVGCTMSDTVTISVLPLPIANITPAGPSTICNGSSITLTADAGVGYNYSWSTLESTQSINTSNPGIVILTVTDSAGCVASDLTSIALTGPVVSVLQSGASLTSNQSGASYQWIDCNNGNAIISGATTQNYIAPANGSYAVIVTFSGCVDTSACYNVTGLGINSLSDQTARIFPNPTDGMFYIEFNNSIGNDYQIMIHNALGQLVQTKKVTAGSNLPVEIDGSSWEPGIYLITGTDTITHQEFKKRIIIQ